MARVVSATGISVGSTLSGDPAKAKTVEQAMIEAVEQAAREGITDPEEIKRRMLKAKEDVQ